MTDDAEYFRAYQTAEIEARREERLAALEERLAALEERLEMLRATNDLRDGS